LGKEKERKNKATPAINCPTKLELAYQTYDPVREVEKTS